LGYLEDTGYPEYDLDAAQTEMEQCLSDLGTDHIEFNYNTTNDPFNVESNTLITSMWEEAFGDQVQAAITPIEQGQYIGLALVGEFEAVGWRSHSGLDPDIQRLWWQSSSALPIGQLALNFGRFQDADMDAQFAIIKSNPDPEARAAAAQEVNRIFGEKVYNWWISWTLWGTSRSPTSTASSAMTCQAARTASGSPSQDSTRPTRCGATRARASDGLTRPSRRRLVRHPNCPSRPAQTGTIRRTEHVSRRDPVAAPTRQRVFR